MRERFAAASPRMRAYAIFKIVPGLVGIPLVIIGAATDHSALVVVGFVFLCVYVAEMAVISPVLIARRSLRTPPPENGAEDAEDDREA